MPLSRRRVLALGAGTGAVAVSTGVLAACGGHALREGGTLAVGLPRLPAVLNPVYATAEATRWIADPVVEALYTYRDDTTIGPVLAGADPVIAPDGLSWTIRLRAGVRFHGGDPFTAEHVVACLRRVNDAATAGDWAPYLAGRFGVVSAPDPQTVRIELPRPFGALRVFLACLPIPHQATLGDPRALVGTGPFRLASATEGMVALRRDPEYRGKAAPLDGIEFRASADGVADLKAGRLGVYPRPAPDQVRRLRKADDTRVQEASGPADLVLLPNLRRAPFDNVGVRRALAFGMDRTRVSQEVYKGAAVIGQGPLGPGNEGWDAEFTPYGRGVSPTATPKPSASATAGPTVAPERVRAMLGEGGVPPGVRFTLLAVVGEASELPDVARVLAEGWNRIGFAVTVENVDAAAWAGRRRAGDFDVALVDNRASYAVGRSAFAVLSPAVSTSGDSTGYVNAEVDRLVEEAWGTADNARRAMLCRLAGEIVARDAVVIPPVYPKVAVGRTGRVEAVDADQLAVGRVELATLHLRE
ncbi:ABC transporter substrate-binding protein [Embleya sp. NBC_00896]|uniref:ABC transporter substrate-binding protein n=1 Tax=Embleya sp. NBC_00896 TaxID=2975961 RepID=UPI00386529DD|nr:ABC transporter substrate-binding protein [Embleya sp. NBC_00896]